MGESGGFWEAVFCTGTYERTLDDKQRLLLPKSVKKSFSGGSGLFLTPGLDECLELHSEESIEKRALEAERSQSSSQTRKSFARLFFAQAENCELDSQNRIRIPQRLIEWSKIENRIVVLGVGPHWEIWNENIWQTYCLKHKTEFDQIAQAITDNETYDLKFENEKVPQRPR